MPIRRRVAAILAICLFGVFSWLLVVSLALSPSADAAALSVVTLANESFEGSFPPSHWKATGHWGKSNCEASVGAFSAWAEGSSPTATCEAVDTIYHPNESARLTFGPFDLSNAVTATLAFDLWLWEAGGDAFAWSVSTNGVNFASITVTEAFSPTWEPHVLNLAAVPGLGDLRGQSNVWIAFAWQTDDFAEAFKGALVDNVRIEKGVAGNDTNTPTVTATATTSTTAHLHLPFVVRPALATGAPTSTPTDNPLPPELTAYAMGDDYTDTGSDCALVGAKPVPITYPGGTKQIAFRLAFDVDQFHGSYKTTLVGDFGGSVTGTSCTKFAIISGSPRLSQVAVRTIRTDGKPLAPGLYKLQVTINGIQVLEVPFSIQ